MNTQHSQNTRNPTFRFFLIILLLGSFCAEVAGARFSKIISFGDSLGDTGNLYLDTGGAFPPFPYFEGRLSNGIVWTEYIAQDLNVEQVDYAYIGAMTGNDNYLDFASLPPGLPLLGLADQVDLYLQDLGSDRIGNRELFLIVIGANDFFDYFEYNRYFPIPTGVENTLDAVHRLVTAGARNVVLANVPNLSKTPEFMVLPEASKAELTFYCMLFNELVADGLAQIEKNYPCRIVVADLFGTIDAIVADPLAFGLNDATTPAILLYPAPADGFLFWDGVHPTTDGHRILADTALEALLNRYIPGKAIGLQRNVPGWLRR